MDSTTIIEERQNKLRFFKKQKLLTAFLLCTAFFIIYYAISGFNIISTNDDYCIFKLIYFGDIAIGCIGFFFTWLCAAVQPFFGNLNSYMILQELICFLSLLAVNYVLLSKLNKKIELLFIAAFDIVCFSFLLLRIQFSYTSIIACTAGFVLLIYGARGEKRKGFKIVQIIGGILLIIAGTQVRYDPVLPMAAVAVAFGFGILLIDFIKHKKENGVKAALKTIFKKYVKTCIILVITSVLVLTLNTASKSLKHTVDGYDELSKYNSAVSQVIDYNTAPFFTNRVFYDEIGITSATDFTIIKHWFIDDEFFTTERLNAIAEYSDEHVNNGIYNKGLLSYVINPLQNAFNESVKNSLIIVYAVALLVAVFAFIIFLALFPKQKAMVIKSGILFLLWIFFVFVTGGFSITNILTLPLIFITYLITFKYDTFQYIKTVLVILALIALYFYITTLRLWFHTSLAVIMPAFAMIILGVDNSSFTAPINKTKKSRILPAIISVLIIISSVISGATIYSSEVKVVEKESNQKLVEYIDSHPDKIFVVNQTCLFTDYFNPLTVPKEHKNLANYGLWVTKSGYMQDTLKRNGIKHIFSDSIDSNIRIILPEVGKDNIKFATELEDYYNAHYAEEGKEIALEKDGSAGHYYFFKVVSRKATGNKDPLKNIINSIESNTLS